MSEPPALVTQQIRVTGVLGEHSQGDSAGVGWLLRKSTGRGDLQQSPREVQVLARWASRGAGQHNEELVCLGFEGHILDGVRVM